MDSLYRALGGEKGVESIVDAMYDRIQNDPLLAPFFNGVDMVRQRTKFRGFLNTVTGGPIQHSPIELRATHSRHVESGLDHGHFDAFLAHFHAALDACFSPPDIKSKIAQKVELARTDILNLDTNPPR